MKAKKPVLGHISPHFSDSIGLIISKNHRAHRWVNPHLPCEFHENLFGTATCYRAVLYIHKYINIVNYLHYSNSSEVDGVRIVVISFQNIAKKKKNSFYS